MTRIFPRLTVQNSLTWTGRGLHGGEPVSVTVHPGTRGIQFTQDGLRVEARAENVTDTRRCTVLGSVATIEHLMSALHARGITDAEIEVAGQELPGLDGSAHEYTTSLFGDPLQACGSIEVTGPFERVYTVHDEVKVGVSLGAGHWRYEFDLEARGLGVQEAEVDLATSGYLAEIAPARTVVFQDEMEMVRKAGLGRGLDETSVLVIGQGRYDNAARFANEPARHKLLDLIGDLALSGVPACAVNVVAKRSGHTVNVEAAAKLASHVHIIRRD